MEMIVFSIFTPNNSHWAWGPRPHPVRPHLHSGRLQRRFSISGPILRPWVDMKTRDTVQSSATSCEASIQPDPCRQSALGRSFQPLRAQHPARPVQTECSGQVASSLSEPQVPHLLLVMHTGGSASPSEKLLGPNMLWTSEFSLTWRGKSVRGLHSPSYLWTEACDSPSRHQPLQPPDPIRRQCMPNSGCRETARRPSAAETHV